MQTDNVRFKVESLRRLQPRSKIRFGLKQQYALQTALRTVVTHSLLPGLDEMLGAPSASATGAPAGGLQLPEPNVGAPPVPTPGGAQEPGLILGDPSNLKLRDPNQKLQLDLER